MKMFGFYLICGLTLGGGCSGNNSGLLMMTVDASAEEVAGEVGGEAGAGAGVDVGVGMGADAGAPDKTSDGAAAAVDVRDVADVVVSKDVGGDAAVDVGTVDRAPDGSMTAVDVGQMKDVGVAADSKTDALASNLTPLTVGVACVNTEQCQNVGKGWCHLGRCCNGCLDTSACVGKNIKAECSKCIALTTTCPGTIAPRVVGDEWKSDPPALCLSLSSEPFVTKCVPVGEKACTGWYCNPELKMCYPNGEWLGKQHDPGVYLCSKFNFTGTCYLGQCQISGAK